MSKRPGNANSGWFHWAVAIAVKLEDEDGIQGSRRAIAHPVGPDSSRPEAITVA